MRGVEVKSDRERYHLILLRHNRTEILVLRYSNGFELPSAEIPCGRRVAESLTQEVKDKWECEAICLSPFPELLRDEEANGRLYQIMECCRPSKTHSNGAFWMPISAWPQFPFSDADAHSYAVLQQLLERSQSGTQWLASPFGQPGWFQELEEWISKVMRDVGLSLTGSFQQLNASASFSLIRFQTTGPAVWFKAVGDPNRHECAITLRLAELLPQYLPKVVDTRPDWNGWLSFESDGTHLSDTDQIGSWETAAAMLARLQIASCRKKDQIVASGARDLCTAIAASIHPFFESVLELMSKQRTFPPPVLTEQEVCRLKQQMHRRLDQLLDLKIPDALGHMDLNPGNIIVSPECATFLDWAEAYVGNPFFTVHYLMEHFRQRFPDSAQVGKLADAYAQEWKRALPAGVIDKGLRLSGPVAVFAYAVRMNDRKGAGEQEDPNLAAYLRSLARRMNREIRILNSQRSSCLC